MRKCIIKLCFLVVIILLSSTISIKSIAAVYPETVRIGIYYGGDQVTSFSVSSKTGVDIGFLLKGTFVKLYEEKTANQAIVRKDGYFVKASDGRLLEYNPNEGIPYEGETLGPYHIRIGTFSPDFASAQAIANNISKTGVSAYVVYESGWQVWTGFYPDSKTANSNIGKISSSIGTSDLSIMPPSPNRTVIYNSAFKVQMIFGGVDGHLYIKSKATQSPALLNVNGRNYRGDFEVRRYSNSDLTVINIVNIEQYLYGVVPSEIESDSPIEAIKAQAVAARTYTYANIGTYGKWGFDLGDSVDSQVYKGYDSERQSTNRAVNETKGKKILYNGKLISALYSSSSGGMTADSKYVWGSEVDYLKSVVDEYEAQTSSRYLWEKTLSPEDVKRILFLKNVEIGEILSVSAEEYSPSGRVIKLRIVGTKDQIVFNNADCRYLFNLNSQKYTLSSGSSVYVKASDGTLKSIAINGRTVVAASGQQTLPNLNSVSVIGSNNNKKNISLDAGNFVFTGKGWGHGVGMSQNGAKGYALQGYNYEQILKHYYTGVTVE